MAMSFVGGVPIESISEAPQAERDRMLLELDLEYPVYGFARHKGYGAPDHLAALAKYGPSPLHRLTFRSVLPRLAERAA